MNDVVGRYKWVGTRPIRPDGVPKVTGKAMYAADYTMPGAIVGGVHRLAGDLRHAVRTDRPGPHPFIAAYDIVHGWSPYIALSR
ncbi:MAG TPA: hypothetical protein VHG31_08755 [Stellaceae bacterium]|nr:hypothetical protein [Stellaceae bacterium]